VGFVLCFFIHLLSSILASSSTLGTSSTTSPNSLTRVDPVDVGLVEPDDENGIVTEAGDAVEERHHHHPSVEIIEERPDELVDNKYFAHPRE
jgi:hypothetical protein